MPDETGPVATSADAQHLVSEQPPDAAIVDFSPRNDEQTDVLMDRLNEQGIYVIVILGYGASGGDAVRRGDPAETD